MSTDIALSRKTKVFASIETTPGVIAWCTAADFVMPAGDATINQVPAFTDSKEMADSLDLIDQFPNAMPAADWSLPMYLRLTGFGTAPQGEAFLKSMQGSKQAGPVTATVNVSGGINASVTTIPYDNLTAGKELPPAGVVTIGTEKIRYSAKSATELTGCVRGYNNTTAATAADDATITLSSQVYKQTTSAPSFTLWMMTDWFLQFVTGATVSNCSVDLKNEDAVTLTLKGQGMQMGYAGVSLMTAAAIATATSIVVADASLFSVGARVQNITKGATNGVNGFAITAVNTATNTLTISPAVPSGGWAIGDDIRGFLPPATPIGQPVVSRDTMVKIAGVSGKIRSTSLSIDVPKSYLTDEIGTEFPEEYVEGQRKIGFDLGTYFKKADVKRFPEGYNALEETVELIMGDTPGYKCSFFMPRVQATMPTISRDGQTLALKIPGTALGTNGEDSLYLCLE